MLCDNILQQVDVHAVEQCRHGGCNNTGVNILLSLQALCSRVVGLAANTGCCMAAEPMKGKFGSSSSKMAGAGAALLPSRDVDSCARRKVTALPTLMIQSQV